MTGLAGGRSFVLGGPLRALVSTSAGLSLPVGLPGVGIRVVMLPSHWGLARLQGLGNFLLKQPPQRPTQAQDGAARVPSSSLVGAWHDPG